MVFGSESGLIYWNNHDLIYVTFWLGMVFLMTLFLWLGLRKKSHQLQMIPLFVITCIILVLEIIKQIVGIVNGYSLRNLPFHFCSMFLFLFPLMVFTKGRVHEFAKTFTFISAAMMFTLFMLSPSRIIGTNAILNMSSSFNNTHTVIYHFLVILFLLTGLSLNMFSVKSKNFWYIPIGLICYGILAIPAAHLLDVNFCNLLSNGLEPFSTIIQKTGYVGYYSFCYILGVLGGAILFYLHYWLNKLLFNKNDDNSSAVGIKEEIESNECI